MHRYGQLHEMESFIGMVGRVQLIHLELCSEPLLCDDTHLRFPYSCFASVSSFHHHTKPFIKKINNNNTGYLSVFNSTGSANATGSNTNSKLIPCLGIISYLFHYCYIYFQYWSLIQNQQELFLQPIRQRKLVSSSSESLQ